MATEKRPTTTTVDLDGPQLIGALRKAGLDPKKLDLKGVLGRGVDVEELQSRLRGPATEAAASWKVSVTVEF
jgi:hypothetical protein